MEKKPTRAPLQFADAVRIAKGCTDYGGGYRQDAALYEAHQDGIATVINALRSAEQTGLDDSQMRALHGIGGGQEKLRAAAPLLLDALQAITDDYAERFDLDDPSTNHGIKSTIKQARAAIAAATN